MFLALPALGQSHPTPGSPFSRSMAEQMRMSGPCPAKWHRCPDDGINQALLKRTSGVLGASESLGPSPGPQEAHEAVFVVRRCNAWSQVPLYQVWLERFPQAAARAGA